MLQILAYSSKVELHQSLLQRDAGDRSWKIVAPFPAKADALRTVWQTRPQTEVVTISRFTQDLFESHWGKETEKAPWRKSRLLLLLNAFKNLHGLYREIDFGTFKTAYQVYSDLRSYTNAPELPDELLTAFDTSVQELVKLFHYGTQKAEVRDEHAAVFDLIAELRGPQGLTVTGNPLLVFEGFTFLTPAQVSFLEALAIRHDVIVPLPQTVLDQSHPWDWPQAVKLSAKLESVGATVSSGKPLTIQSYSPGTLGAVLRAWRESVTGSVQIVLGTKTPTDGSLQEIPFADAFFKREVDVTSEARDVLWMRWEERFAQQRETIPGTMLLQWCAEEKVLCVAEKSMAAMRRYKVVQMVEEALTSVENCLAHQELNSFLLRLVKEIVALDAPRNHLIPLLRNTSTVKVLGLRDVDSINPGQAVALCLDSSLGPIKSDHRPYSPELERELAKLGPVKRPELDFLFLRAELEELLDAPITVFMEQDLLKHDLAWKQIFSERPLIWQQWQTMVAKPARPDYGFFHVSEKAVPAPELLSATRVQDYLDCPRHYHAKRIEKIIPQVSAQLEVDAMEIGKMEHTLVELAWRRGEAWWSQQAQLEAEAAKLLENNPVKRSLSAVQTAAVIAEVSLYASNGLRMLRQVQQALPQIKFEFEVELKTTGKTGFIDCLGDDGETTLLIDFKRAKSSNPGINQWADFEKIQLWFYLNALTESGKLRDKVVAGYFFFKDMEKSWLASSDPEVHARLEQTMGKRAEFYPQWTENFTTYQSREAEIIERLRQEREFLPVPLTAKVCNFCELQALCPKSSSEREDA